MRVFEFATALTSLLPFLKIYSNFDEIARLVVKRAKEIPLHHRLLFWHHILKHAYGYLAYERI